ncbi:MAG: hypothetical protein AABN34_17425 [Acidobacteriota bacterium]
MWREDDFEDKGKQIKGVPKDRGGELLNDPDLEPEGKAESAQELSH